MLVKKKLSRTARIFKFIILLVSAGFAAYFVYFSPIFRITGLEIVGDGASSSEVNAYLGDLIGSNIIFWRPNGATADLSKKLAHLEVRKDFLNRQIIVAISERDKLLIWCYVKTDSCFWVDKSGTIFDEAPKSNGSLIYVVEDATDIKPVIGNSALDQSLFSNLVRVLDILKALKLPVQAMNIDDAKFRELVVYLINGPKIVFGLSINPDFMETALSSLKNTTPVTEWKKIKLI